MSKSKIDWVKWTWNPFIGCTPCSPGCENCWARREEDGRFRRLHRCIHTDSSESADEAGARAKGGTPASSGSDDSYFWSGPVWQGDKVLERPLHWRDPRNIFVCSRSDLFHPDISFDQIDRVKAVEALCPQHFFLELTKRAERMAEYYAWTNHGTALPLDRVDAVGLAAGKRWGIDIFPWPLPNVGLGVTICNQDEADEKIPKLLGCPAAMRFVSIEPMLGPLNLCAVPPPAGMSRVAEFSAGASSLGGLDWVIVGCESGKNRRPCMLEWVRSIVEQCRAAGVPCFVKQLATSDFSTVNRRSAYKTKVLHDPAEWPADLRVRELPAQLRNEGCGMRK